jgi:hypothetical protein
LKVDQIDPWKVVQILSGALAGVMSWIGVTSLNRLYKVERTAVTREAIASRPLRERHRLSLIKPHYSHRPLCVQA